MQPEPSRRGEVTFPGGEQRPALGLGTWRLGESGARATAEVRALRQALEIGYRVFDTAEMYADGGAEEVLGRSLDEALRGGLRREELFVVSKVLPEHADAAGVVAACERSLRRLRLGHLDLYLLHWRSATPLHHTLRGFEQLQQRGLIRHWGVSNFDIDDMQELAAVPGGAPCAANQVYCSLSQRGALFDLWPWQQERQMPLMAYSPIDQGALAEHAALRPLAERHRATPAQIALAWLLQHPGLMAIPKAGQPLHLQHNWDAAAIELDDADRARIDRAFPPPRRPQALAMR